MRLPVFLIGLGAVTAMSVLLGTVAGFGGWTLVLFVLAVVTVAQIAYVALVAWLATEESAKRNAPADPRHSESAMPPRGPVPPKKDA